MPTFLTRTLGATLPRRAVLAGLAGLALATSGPPALAADADPWAEMAKPGTAVLFRHATAPGTGDPANFRLGDCRTQRNLNEAGRAEARRLGEQFRARKVRIGQVLTSQWCRTRETATLAFGDNVREEPAFNSFFAQSPSVAAAQTAQAAQVLRNWQGPGVLVVVTHQVNISALTDHYATSGEGVVVRADEQGRWRTVATLRP